MELEPTQTKKIMKRKLLAKNVTQELYSKKGIENEKGAMKNKNDIEKKRLTENRSKKNEVKKREIKKPEKLVKSLTGI